MAEKTEINFDVCIFIRTFATRMTEEIKQLKQLLSFPKEITIVTHRNPDGDAIGSSMGLASYLKKGHHNILRAMVLLPVFRWL